MSDYKEAIAETLRYYDTEFPLEKYPERESWFISAAAHGITVGQLRALAKADAITEDEIDLTVVYMYAKAKANDEIRSLERRIEALRKALEPFAEWDTWGINAEAALKADDEAKILK